MSVCVNRVSIFQCQYSPPITNEKKTNPSPRKKNFKKKKIPQIIFILSFCLANNGVFNNDNNNTIKEIIITIRKNEKE